jgi:hypothetical protein
MRLALTHPHPCKSSISACWRLLDVQGPDIPLVAATCITALFEPTLSRPYKPPLAIPAIPAIPAMSSLAPLL